MRLRNSGRNSRMRELHVCSLERRNYLTAVPAHQCCRRTVALDARRVPRYPGQRYAPRWAPSGPAAELLEGPAADCSDNTGSPDSIAEQSPRRAILRNTKLLKPEVLQKHAQLYWYSVAPMAAPSSSAFIAFARRFPVIQPISVAWGEMDAFKHVNNVFYYRYFETARMAHVLQLLRAVPPSDPFDGKGLLEATGIGVILASSSCVFKVPVAYPDILYAGSSIVVPDQSHDRFGMDFALYSTRAGRIAATGHAVTVLYDYRIKRKATHVPPGLLHAMREVEGYAAARTNTDIARLEADAQAALTLPSEANTLK